METSLDTLDILAAEKVMGYVHQAGHYFIIPTRERIEKPVMESPLPKVVEFRPTHNIAQAMECWQKILDSGEFCCCSISYPAGEGWEVSLTKVLSEEHKPVIVVGGQGRYENASEAIVRACLRAKGVEL